MDFDKKDISEETNKVILSGVLQSQFTFSHEIQDKKFYIATLAVERTSKAVDLLPVLAPEELLDEGLDYAGRFVHLEGEYRSFNDRKGEANRLVLRVFLREMELAEEDCTYVNQIQLDGYVCRAPVFRKTPMGREVSDLLVAVNRKYGKSDYIPCICWGKQAHVAADLEVGSRISITGRVQSREYIKRTADGEKKRTAYEVSASEIRKIEESEREE